MYLLKPEMGGTTDTNKRSFTFHHVSIKTNVVVTTFYLMIDSHSTMYLLKPVASSSISYTS